eukprot:tig00021339_g20406.t1
MGYLSSRYFGTLIPGLIATEMMLAVLHLQHRWQRRARNAQQELQDVPPATKSGLSSLKERLRRVSWKNVATMTYLSCTNLHTPIYGLIASGMMLAGLEIWHRWQRRARNAQQEDVSPPNEATRLNVAVLSAVGGITTYLSCVLLGTPTYGFVATEVVFVGLEIHQRWKRWARKAPREALPPKGAGGPPGAAAADGAPAAPEGVEARPETPSAAGELRLEGPGGPPDAQLDRLQARHAASERRGANAQRRLDDGEKCQAQAHRQGPEPPAVAVGGPSALPGYNVRFRFARRLP